nr:uncharacterized protein LOC111511912 [Leptinotarsa decemlineata]
MDDEIKTEIFKCIEESKKTENLSGLKIDLTGTNEKGEGYIADFVFATVSGTDENNQLQVDHLAIKMGKRSKELREKMPAIMEMYKREELFYEKVLPTFLEFQLEKKVENPFNAVPKCLNVHSTDVLTALVFENLKKCGYSLHDKRQPMNLQHIRLVLKNYAKLHALSFALRDQEKEKFDELTSWYYSVLKKMVIGMNMSEKSDTVPKKLREAGRDDLAAKYEDQMETGRENVLLKCLDDVPKESVITHGDCHNNNFLFKYEDGDKENPVKVAILDWQVSELHSPVMDLSYFLYATASKEELAQLDVLLKYYHANLSDFMEALGSDAGKLFPYDTLVEHWKKYSVFQFRLTTGFLKLLYVDKDDAPSIEDVKGDGDMDEIFREMKLTDENLYTDRLISIVDHYFNFLLA